MAGVKLRAGDDGLGRGRAERQVKLLLDADRAGSPIPRGDVQADLDPPLGGCRFFRHDAHADRPVTEIIRPATVDFEPQAVLARVRLVARHLGHKPVCELRDRCEVGQLSAAKFSAAAMSRRQRIALQ